MSAFHFGLSAVSTPKNGHSCAMSSILLENEIVLFSSKQDLVSGFLCWFPSWCSLCVRSHTHTHTHSYTHKRMKKNVFQWKNKKRFFNLLCWLHIFIWFILCVSLHESLLFCRFISTSRLTSSALIWENGPAYTLWDKGKWSLKILDAFFFCFVFV